ncbi:MAG: hypothetical protein Q8S84_06355 [bacterium]|nr:hypothetical protein [bacterium]MDP3381096.1 hypothetical protein [bacterium]
MNLVTLYAGYIIINNHNAIAILADESSIYSFNFVVFSNFNHSGKLFLIIHLI